ncbi:hypothetical protein CC79DRAFT_1279716 [Sarocladium strictum]
MPKQKTGFRKSHGGCKRCRQRKVKCNEARPVCNNCHRHNTTCEYGVSFQPVQLPAGEIQDRPQRTLLTSVDDESHPFLDSISRRRLELELMHHFITVTCPTFPASSLQLGRGLWTVDAVRLAFQHEFLLNAIHAIAALHLVRDLPDTTTCQLAKVHGFYLDLAVTQQRKAVADITPENANALVFASVLLSYQGLRLLPAEPGSVAQPYKPPVQWLRMGRGINDVSAVAGHIGHPEPVIPYMLRVSGEPNFRNKETFFNASNRARFAHLLQFDSTSDPENDVEAWVGYEEAVGYIGYMAKAIESQELPRILWRLVLGFGILMPSTFIDCVEIGRPRALIILAHYFALAKSVDDHWIFAGLANREVAGIHDLLPQELQHYLAWPLRVVDSSPLALEIS